MAATLELPATPHLAAARAGKLPLDAILTRAELRRAWSTASCLYRVPPAAVAFPSSPGGLRELLLRARARGLALTARGGGSGLVGNALGRGLVIDCRAGMTRLLAMDEIARTATVEPGIFIGELNDALAARGLFFPVEPSSAACATVGGAVASNAGGARSVKYGSAVRWLEGAEGVFADGTPFAWTRAGGLESSPEWRARLALLAARLRGALRGLAPPAVDKIASGYRLEALDAEALADGNSRGLLPLLAGSEGTLVLFSRLTLRLAKKPGGRRTGMLVFPSLAEASRAIPPLLAHRPSATELLDRTAIRMALAFDPALSRHFRGDEAAALLVECEGAGETAAADALAAALDELRGAGLRFRAALAPDRAASEELWALRRITSPVVHAGCGGKLGLRFIEDGVVPPARVPEFVAGVKALCARKKTDAVFFGHIGSGNIHINPFLDPHSRTDRAKLAWLYDGFTELVDGLGGAPSGEHGDGRLRSRPWNARHGKLAALYREIKAAFDPDGVLNPGIKTGPAPDPLAAIKYRVSRA